MGNWERVLEREREELSYISFLYGGEGGMGMEEEKEKWPHATWGFNDE